MAIYHFSVKAHSRCKQVIDQHATGKKIKYKYEETGVTATAAAAYRAGERLVDDKTGEVHDYSRKKGVASKTIFAPPFSPAWAHDRERLWNAVEASETRKNSTIAREFEVALPVELSAVEREKLAHAFAKQLVKDYGCVADVAIHKPSRNGDHRNHHAHILCSCRRMTSHGFGEKIRELDVGPKEVVKLRKLFSDFTNEFLERNGFDERVDFRSHKDRGIERVPTAHRGPAITAMERRGEATEFVRRERERIASSAIYESVVAADGQSGERSIEAIEADLRKYRVWAAMPLDKLRRQLLDAERVYQEARWELTKWPELARAAKAEAEVLEARRRLPIEQKRLLEAKKKRSAIVAIAEEMPLYKSKKQQYAEAARLAEAIQAIEALIDSLFGVAQAPIYEQLPTMETEIRLRMARAKEVVDATGEEVLAREAAIRQNGGGIKAKTLDYLDAGEVGQRQTVPRPAIDVREISIGIAVDEERGKKMPKGRE